MNKWQKDSEVLTWKMKNRASLKGMSCLPCQLGCRRQLVPDSAPEELARRKVIVFKQWMACIRILKKELLYYQFGGLLLIQYCNMASGSGKYLIRRSFAQNEISEMPTRSLLPPLSDDACRDIIFPAIKMQMTSILRLCQLLHPSFAGFRVLLPYKL